MNTWWKIFCGVFAFLLVAAGTVFSQETASGGKPENSLRPENESSLSGRKLKNFPKTDIPEAVYKNVEKNYFFDAAGACEFRQKTELRINTLFAMNELCGETFIVYNPKFQRIKINAAYTIMADGVTRVDVPENALNSVLPRCAADAPAFNFLQELVITHTALEPGATIFLDYSVFFAENAGILFDEYADMPFPCERLVLNFNGSSSEYFNVPARSREHYFTAKRTIPVIYPGMRSVKPRDFCETEQVELGELGAGILRSLFKESMSEQEKKIAVIRFVRDRISVIPIPSYLLLESDLRTPDEVLKSAYGTPPEKARLLWAMLSKAFGNDFKIIRDADEDVFFVKTGLGERIPVVPNEKELSSVSLEARCEFSGGKEYIRGTAVCPVSETDVKKAAAFLSAKGTRIAEAEWLPENRLNAVFERDADSRDAVRIWTVPVAERGIATLDFKTLPRRRTSELKIPVRGESFSESYSYLIRLPEAWKLAGSALSAEIQNPVGQVRFLAMQDGRDVVVVKDLVLKKTTIAPEEYSQFRDLIVAWFEPGNNRLIFVEQSKSAPEPEKK